MSIAEDSLIDGGSMKSTSSACLVSTPTSPPPTSLSSAFPARASSSSGHKSETPSPCSIAPPASLRTPEQLQQELQSVTRYAIASLATFFCKLALDSIVQCLGMPEKTARSLKGQLEGESALKDDDLAELIMKIKTDPTLLREGSLVVVGSLLLALVSTGTCIRLIPFDYRIPLASGNYDSRYRVLLRHLAVLLGAPWEEFEDLEVNLSHLLIADEYVETELAMHPGQSKKAREKASRGKKIKRYLTIGVAGGVGGVLIGLTGGLAAPLVALGASTIIGGSVAGATIVAGLTTTAGAAILGSSMGVAGAGLTGYKMNKRVGAIEEFSIETLSEGTSLRCVLAISGWIDKDTLPEMAFTHQWRHLRAAAEQYTLHYESKYLKELGSAMDYLMSFAVTMAIQHSLMETALAGLVSAVAWPVALLGCASVLDNPWNVCIARSAEVGEHLAEILLSRAHGKRPITLIGFSLGARTIFHCLLTMAKRGESAGIIEDVILLGAPVTASPKQWDQISRVVGGRIINGYSNSDWMLRFLYRTMSVQFSIAGTTAIDNKRNKKIVNCNLSHVVNGHLDYSRKLTEVLDAVGIKVAPHSENSIVDFTALDAARASEGMDGHGDTVRDDAGAADSTSHEQLLASGDMIDRLTLDVSEIRVKDVR
ncbi:hypothetical protein PRIPAC_88736 [Pristionchus pacificus]|uniref:Uncharacterized protein n=1 Tax=Pristionchus pacificus TaxID=54126 RepID=A0A2A6CVL3_PRIPA|nr:hypothetical protein PRIPAC_88736 [Pristionchus pacificus]|eukprot:PDM82083.1 hypothetical protein PRIPAC_36476 [Pristionchus pacificus]